MRKTFVVGLLVSALLAGPAMAFDMMPSGSASSATPPSAGANLDAGQRFTDPTDKLLKAPLGGLETEQGDRKSFQFGDKNSGLTFQGSTATGPVGAGRYFSMENNPWR